MLRNDYLREVFLAPSNTRLIICLITNTDWLKDHPKDTHVRARFLTFLSALPERLKNLKATGADFIAEWVISQALSWKCASPPEQRNRDVVVAALNLVANNASAAQVKRVLVETTAIFTNADGANEVVVLVKGLLSITLSSAPRSKGSVVEPERRRASAPRREIRDRKMDRFESQYTPRVSLVA